LTASSLIEAPLTHDIAMECDNFELPGGDPFDRIIVATARVLDMALLTHDEAIIRSGTIAVLAGD
jgi:PIN domain nuclease of toxin-antitoxin system